MKCNPIIDLLKFTSIKNTLSGIVSLIYNQVCYQTLFLLKKIVLLDYLGKLLEYVFRLVLGEYDAMSAREW